ncbi:MULTISPECIES: hypothetical protein [Cupriavidus]|uniref:Uncharacterized protein n=1 Tax=Cupriavidus pauculus TaxID=82633 RepID=A0A5P2HCS2_9BURK|nr:hypothetical protein [Cupriavidus pauculus]QET05588.1 hypothetical protein FOB72_26680 [Cupriavidus pauculus]
MQRNTLLGRAFPACLPLLALLLATSSARAETFESHGYPKWGTDGYCRGSGYWEDVGVITRVTAGGWYHSDQAMFVELTVEGGRRVGGQVATRAYGNYAYDHLVRMAMFLQATGSRARVCWLNGYVYAIEMH